MINGIGVLGWGVGGIEAEAAMLGQPLFMRVPEVVGFRLTGALPPGTTATDLVLAITQLLRNHGVVDKFVEFFGPGLAALSVADRATISNMCPEYGATSAFFPVDEQTLAYLASTGRSAEQSTWWSATAASRACSAGRGRRPEYAEVLELDLGPGGSLHRRAEPAAGPPAPGRGPGKPGEEPRGGAGQGGRRRRA